MALKKKKQSLGEPSFTEMAEANVPSSKKKLSIADCAKISELLDESPGLQEVINDIPELKQQIDNFATLTKAKAAEISANIKQAAGRAGRDQLGLKFTNPYGQPAQSQPQMDDSMDEDFLDQLAGMTSEDTPLPLPDLPFPGSVPDPGFGNIPAPVPELSLDDLADDSEACGMPRSNDRQMFTEPMVPGFAKKSVVRGVAGPSGGYGEPQVKRRQSKPSKYDSPVAVDKQFSPDQLDPNDVSDALTPSDVEDFEDLKNAIRVQRSDDRTLVFAISIDRDNDDKNLMTAIRCNGGTAFGGYAHDLPRDSYLVRCVECVQLGQLPFSYQITMPNIGEWRQKVPIPEGVLEKHLTPQNKKVLDEYRRKWPKSRYDIHFVQMLGCH